jgi:UDP-N-acetylmuramate--alanine ligase
MRKHYHLIGIGGIGMAALASLLLAKGHKVSGSDLKASDLTGRLKENGAEITIGHHASNVRGPDFVIYSSAVSIANPERIESVSRGIPVLRRAEVLAQLVNEEIAITVAGAHGKTTTTSMVASLLGEAGLNPTTAVGGIVKGSDHHAHLGEGKYFVAEVDESDGTFLYFKPHFSIITNVDFEHVDHYKDWDGILSAYAKFMQCTRPGGTVIICGQDERLRRLAKAHAPRTLVYGFDPSFDVMAADVVTDGFNSRFSCRTPQGKLGDFELAVGGEHNVLNALACITLGLALKIDLAVIRRALGAFSGVRRRFQFKGEADDIMVVDDYGHHPTEITATLKAARLFAGRRLLTVFQPHRYSRTKFLLDEFAHSFDLTDELILTDIYAAGEKPNEGITTPQLFQRVRAVLGRRAAYVKKELVVETLARVARPGDLVLFLGAGDITDLCEPFLAALKERVADQRVGISHRGP